MKTVLSLRDDCPARVQRGCQKCDPFQRSRQRRGSQTGRGQSLGAQEFPIERKLGSRGRVRKGPQTHSRGKSPELSSRKFYFSPTMSEQRPYQASCSAYTAETLAEDVLGERRQNGGLSWHRQACLPCDPRWRGTSKRREDHTQDSDKRLQIQALEMSLRFSKYSFKASLMTQARERSFSWASLSTSRRRDFGKRMEAWMVWAVLVIDLRIMNWFGVMTAFDPRQEGVLFKNGPDRYSCPGLNPLFETFSVSPTFPTLS